MHFSRAIVRPPGIELAAGLSSTAQQTPDYQKALRQHSAYVSALQRCGLDVTIMPASDTHPDATFVEDVAILTPEAAILTNPGAPSRHAEVELIRHRLWEYYPELHPISAPGTLDGGDVLQIGKNVYIGLSGRTNRAGAEQLIAILQEYGYRGTMVPVQQFLHLKTGVTQVAEQTLVAANSLAFNSHLLIPAGCPQTRTRLEAVAATLIEIDISEFAKIDGGLTCLSLRF